MHRIFVSHNHTFAQRTANMFGGVDLHSDLRTWIAGDLFTPGAIDVTKRRCTQHEDDDDDVLYI